MAHQQTLLFLGAGSNTGASSVALFKSKGYKVASAARTIRSEVKAHSDLVISADFSDPSCFKGIFERVEKDLGVPNVVIYNCKLCSVCDGSCVCGSSCFSFDFQVEKANGDGKYGVMRVHD